MATKGDFGYGSIVLQKKTINAKANLSAGLKFCYLFVVAKTRLIFIIKILICPKTLNNLEKKMQK